MNGRKLSDLEFSLCRDDAHKFIFGIEVGPRWSKFLYTKDEHNIDVPKQYFPDKPYLRVILDCLLVSGGIIPHDRADYALEWGFPKNHMRDMGKNRIFFLEKSRQVTITWIVLAYCLWRAKFMEHQLILVQSKRGEDAKKLTCVKKGEPDSARMSFMENSLPPHLQNTERMLASNIYFKNGSHVWGIPEGGDIIRGNTPSVLFSDEAAFQPSFGDAHRAALPAIQGGGQGIFVSSAEPGDFQRIIESTR